MDEDLSKEAQLFGHPVIRSPKITLAEQVFDIFCQEIHAGRWEVDEKLPSISLLAEQCGISSRPIHQAFEKLQEEGFLHAERGSGTYIKSIFPQGATPVGVIGILLARQDEAQLANVHEELDQWRMHALIEEAARRNYTEEVKYLPRDHDGTEIDKVGGLFSPNVKGIISLHNFPRADLTVIPEDRIPFVYLGYSGFTRRPRVTLDVEEGFYRLTQRVISEGHESIICMGPEPGADEETVRSIFGGYEQAMLESGLTPHKQAFIDSREIQRGAWRDYRTYLENYGEDTTAFICGKSHRAMDVIVVADIMAIRIPEDLSVVSFSSQMRSSNPEQRITGIDYHLTNTVRECYDLLFKQINTRRCDVSVVQVKSLICEGDSLAPPREIRLKMS